MSDFDDDLRRLLGDERLALTPRADATARIVRGARRRRTIRLAASAAGSAALVAAVAIGSVAAVGQFSAGPDLDPAPAETPTDLLPGPEGAEGTAPATPSPPGVDPTGTPDASASGTPGAGEEPSGEEEPDRTAAALLDPAAPFDGVRVRMTLDELRRVPGVEITRLRGDGQFAAACYGSFRTERAHGYISLRGTLGSIPGDPAELQASYEVATLVPDVAVRTPEGLSTGSTTDDLLDIYPDAQRIEPDVYTVPLSGLDGVFSLWRIHLADGLVDQIVHDGVDNCGENPRPVQSPPPADLDVPGGDVFGPIRLGMTMDDLRAIDGIELTEWADSQSRPYCWGGFRLGDVSGTISVLRDVSTGELPPVPESEAEYIVSSVGSTGTGIVTPEGVGVGSTLDQVAAAQPGFTTDDPMSSIPGAPATQGVRWMFEVWDADVVQRLSLDAGHSCIQ